MERHALNPNSGDSNGAHSPHSRITHSAMSQAESFEAARVLVRRLRGVDPTVSRPRVRIGVLLLPHKYLANEEDVAVRIGAQAVSLAQRVLDARAEGSAYLGLDVDDLLRHLDDLATAKDDVAQMRASDCDLVTNLDLLLAHFDERARDEFWREARDRLSQRSRALILTMPLSAHFLLPSIREWQSWEESKRVVTLF